MATIGGVESYMLVPLTLFFASALASVAMTAGVYLARLEGYNFFSLPMMTAGVVAIILSAQGFGLILPDEARIFPELRKEHLGVQKVVKLGMGSIYLSGSQSVFHTALIVVVAYPPLSERSVMTSLASRQHDRTSQVSSVEMTLLGRGDAKAKDADVAPNVGA